jgi:hypothetical protein
MQTHNANTDAFPQVGRSPESFPKLTVFPDDWDLSAILPPTQPGDKKSSIHQKFSEQGTNAGTSNPF